MPIGPIEVYKKHEASQEGIWDYIVELGPEGDQIGFLVHLDPATWERLTKKKRSPEELLKKTFEFLLERESRMALEREFDCGELISSRPEYEESMRKKLRKLPFF